MLRLSQTDTHSGARLFCGFHIEQQKQQKLKWNGQTYRKTSNLFIDPVFFHSLVILSMLANEQKEKYTVAIMPLTNVNEMKHSTMNIMYGVAFTHDLAKTIIRIELFAT